MLPILLFILLCLKPDYSTLSNARQFYSSNRFFTHQFFSTRKYFIFVTCIAINAMVLEGTFFQSSRHFCRPKFSSYPHTASPSSTTNQWLLKDSVDLEFQCICNEEIITTAQAQGVRLLPLALSFLGTFSGKICVIKSLFL